MLAPGLPSVILWRRGFTVLSTGHTLLTMDTRFAVKVEQGKSILSISMVQEADAGEYVCQMTTMEGVREQSHLLEVSGTITMSPCTVFCTPSA